MIMVVIGQVVLAAFVFFIMHGNDLWVRVVTAALPFCFVPVWYLLKLPTVPPLLADEAEAENTTKRAVLEAERDQARTEAAELKRPRPAPARDPDGIYQHGRMVASASGAEKHLGRGYVRFSALHGSGDFDPSSAFEYHDLVLKYVKADAETKAGLAGRIEKRAFHNALCQVLGRT
jgi:hypothetical protein